MTKLATFSERYAAYVFMAAASTCMKFSILDIRHVTSCPFTGTCSYDSSESSDEENGRS